MGSKFRIFFAVVDAAGGEPVGDGARTGSTPSKREKGRLLIVDDEDGVRLTAKRLLEKQGYLVYAAAGGTEALDLLEKHGPVDLVIADLAMPEMDGRELGEQIQKHHPGVPVMYMSGYFNDPSLSQSSALKVTGYLAKPFSREQLFETVRSAMAKDA